jgi:hypothetical protein
MSVQLDLFEGKILTTEQRLEIQKFIERCDKEVVRKQKRIEEFNYYLMKLVLDKVLIM